MAELATAYVNIVASSRGLGSQLSRDLGVAGASAGSEAGKRFTGGMKGFLAGGAVAGIAASAASGLAGVFGGFIKEAAVASDATDKFKATMSFAGLDTTTIDNATKAAKAYADQTVFDLPTIQNTMAQLASNGVKDFTGLTKAAGNLNAVAGGNADSFKSVAMVMTQTAGAGKLTTENWNQLADAIPGAAGPLTKALQDAGAFTGNFRDAMSEGQITSDEFNTALSKLGNQPVAVEAAKSTKTFEGSLGGLQATITGGLTTALNGIKPLATNAINGLSSGIGKGFEGISAIYDSFAGGFENASAKVESGGLSGFFTTLGGTVRTIFDAFAPLIPQVLTLASSFSPLGLIFKALEPVLPQIVGLITTLASTLSGALAGILPTITTLVTSLVGTLSGVFVSIMPVIVQLVDALGKAFEMLAPVVGQILEAVAPLIASLVSQLAPIFTELVTTIMPPIIDIFMNIVSAIQPLVTMLLSILIPVIQALMPVVVTVFGVIANVIRSVMQIVQGIIQVVTGIISGNWDQVWQGIQNIFSGIWNTIVAVIQGAIGIVGSVITAGLNIIGSIWNTVWGGISSFFGGIWDGITSTVSTGFDTVMKFFQDLPGKITGFFAGAGTWLLDAGKNIIDGLIGGIGSMMGAIGEAILSIVPGPIVGVFKDALGIHSPSRVFDGFGVNIGQGLINGIDGMHSKVATATKGLAAVPSMTDIKPIGFAGTGGAAAGAGGRLVQVDVHASDGMDAVTVGQIAGNTVNNELRRLR